MREILDRSLSGDIHVEMKFGADLWPVEIDAGEFELTMLNLCVNARDAMAGGGTITVTAENRQEAGESGPPGDFVELSVADTGCGMPPEVLGRAFEPFFTTKDVGKGSGLGLPQVYGFAQQSGGRVRIDSAVGEGTVVTLSLPRSLWPAAAAGPDDASSVAPAPSDERCGLVLLVEDDNEVAALTREMLCTFGFTVIHAASPAAALGALADARSVDLVLSDIMMPGDMSGLELAREIRRRHPNLPIVLTTGYAEAASSMDTGEFGLVLKPYSAEALAAALRVDVK
jgi:CheY-like chemotaxis protein